MNSNIFRHLELEIALAIPASNDEKYNWNISAGQGLKIHTWSDQSINSAIIYCDLSVYYDKYITNTSFCQKISD